MNFTGSKTEQNLIKSYLGELTGELLYEIFAEQAQKESYFDIANSFKQLAIEERNHSDLFKRFLKQDIEFKQTKDELQLLCKDTLSNLKFSSIGEYKAYEEIYPNYSKIAEEEGFYEISKTYLALKNIELRHSQLLEKLILSIENKI
ncbi:MAG: ferritin family protein [Cetobacterium sp.]|uniref:ferritin family protein n=1 Tax=Cetobacterium sp. TaxID=2071632 RepID=UPI002FC80259